MRNAIHSLLKNALVNISGPNTGDTEGQDKDTAETGAVRFHFENVFGKPQIQVATWTSQVYFPMIIRRLRRKSEKRLMRRESKAVYVFAVSLFNCRFLIENAISC